ncbi:hypothetical protein JKY72_02840 [Candidatus Gracilibacteria bacterium]|nr:hypothetical protein [Candidatus Gracilibacteria bacterium]
MKKLIAKFLLFSLISALISVANPAVYADEHETTGTPAETSEDVEGPSVEAAGDTYQNNVALGAKASEMAKVFDKLTDCISIKDTEQYIVVQSTTVFQEEASGAGTDFEVRTCFQNLLSYWELNDKGQIAKETRIPKLTKNRCGDKEAYKFTSDKALEKYKVGYSCNEIQIILSKGGTTLIEGYIGMIYRWGARMAGIIAVLVIVISGIQLSVSAGDDQAVTSAKERIIRSLAGLAVLFLAGLILNTINPNFYVF